MAGPKAHMHVLYLRNPSPLMRLVIRQNRTELWIERTETRRSAEFREVAA